MITIQNEKVIRIYDGERMQIEAWGKNSFRVRVTKLNQFTDEDWALIMQPDITPEINIMAKRAYEEVIQANAEERIEGTDPEEKLYGMGQYQNGI